eukprot:764827-Hanusia_phi.AAC.1
MEVDFAGLFEEGASPCSLSSYTSTDCSQPQEQDSEASVGTVLQGACVPLNAWDEPLFDLGESAAGDDGESQTWQGGQHYQQPSRKTLLTRDSEQSVHEQQACEDISHFFSVHCDALGGKRAKDMTKEKLSRVIALHEQVRDWQQQNIVKLDMSGVRSMLGFTMLTVLDEVAFEQRLADFGNVQAWKAGKGSMLMHPEKATEELLRQCGLMKRRTSPVRYVYAAIKIKAKSDRLFTKGD